MLAVKQGFPEENEIVICTVTKVHFHSVFVHLDEYNKSGMIHISEVSPGRIRNIRDFVKEGKVVVCKVLRVNKERNQIDLSLRRVTEMQRRNKINEMKQEQKAEKIIEYVAAKFQKTAKELYDAIAPTVLKDYPSLYSYFESVVTENLPLNLNVDKRISDELLNVIKQRIKPAEIEISGDFILKSYAPNGVEIIRTALQKANSLSESVTIKYRGAGRYHIVIKAPTYKEGEEILKKAKDVVFSDIQKLSLIHISEPRD